MTYTVHSCRKIYTALGRYLQEINPLVPTVIVDKPVFIEILSVKPLVSILLRKEYRDEPHERSIDYEMNVTLETDSRLEELSDSEIIDKLHPIVKQFDKFIFDNPPSFIEYPSENDISDVRVLKKWTSKEIDPSE